MEIRFIVFNLLIAAHVVAAAPEGFQDATWGMSPDQVRQASGAAGWANVGGQLGFPPDLNIEAFQSRSEVAGYQATVTYYFFEQQFFQATVVFDFSHLENYDFNYNVYRSVDEYYTAIHDETLTFVRDIYDLLEKKYGKRQPVFDRLDPKKVFVRTNKYLQREKWNLRYHPYEYYRKIIGSAYARWNFPKTRITFSVNISAADKRFDYQLSLTSLDLERDIRKSKDEIRSRNL